VLFAARAAVRDRSAGLTAALVWAALPYLFFSLIATKLYSYVCVAVPALSLLLGYGAASLWTARRGPLRPVFTAALLIWGVQTAAVARERLMADYRLSPWNDFYDYPSFRRAMLEIRADTSPKVIFNVRDSKAAQAMYYAGASAYEQTPTVDVLRSLADRGYRIYFVIHDQKLTAEFLPALQAAGLAGKVRLVPLPNPRENRPKHPYEA
jgi:hypothetical protein